MVPVAPGGGSPRVTRLGDMGYIDEIYPMGGREGTNALRTSLGDQRGKTLAILQQAPDLDVTALDSDPDRLKRVAENVARGGGEASLYAADASKPGDPAWSGRTYDRILVDAPCSAAYCRARSTFGELPEALIGTATHNLPGGGIPTSCTSLR